LADAGQPLEGGDPTVTQLKALRDRLQGLIDKRGSAEAVLVQLEKAARRGADRSIDLGRDLGEQRAGIGGLYAELATDAAKAGDKARAKRLLTAAAHLDPGNHGRYEKQLQAFDKTATLDRSSSAAIRPSGVTKPIEPSDTSGNTSVGSGSGKP